MAGHLLGTSLHPDVAVSHRGSLSRKWHIQSCFPPSAPSLRESPEDPTKRTNLLCIVFLVADHWPDRTIVAGAFRSSAWATTRSCRRTPWRTSWPPGTAACSSTRGRTRGTSVATSRCIEQWWIPLLALLMVAAAVVVDVRNLFRDELGVHRRRVQPLHSRTTAQSRHRHDSP